VAELPVGIKVMIRQLCFFTSRVVADRRLQGHAELPICRGE
jgi:hypothetical protein